MQLFFGQCRAARRYPLAAWIIVCALFSERAPALGLAFSVESIVGDDWRVEGVSVAAGSERPGRYALDVSVGTVRLPGEYGTLSGIHLSCDPVRRDGDGWTCPAGRLSSDSSPIGVQEAEWSGRWTHDGRLNLEVPRLRVANGEVSATLEYQAAGWTLDIAAHRVSVDAAHRLSEARIVPADWTLDGYANGRLRLQGVESIGQADLELVVDGMAFASPDGTQAAEDLVLRVDLATRVQGDQWRFDGNLRWPTGALYSEPLFVDAGEAPLTIDLTGVFEPARGRLQLDSAAASIQQAFTLTGAGRFTLDPWSVRDMTLAAHSDDAGTAFGLLLQPFLIGTPADDLEVTGQVGFVLHFDERGIEQAGLSLNRLSAVDRRGRFALHPSDGSVAWQRAGSGSVSSLTTEGVSLFALRSGAFAADARFVGDQLTLISPIVVPVLGGEVALDAFTLSGALVEGASPTWSASASVAAISLDQLTRELQWPPFSGSLSAELNDMRYREQMLEVGGGLRLTAFDGEIRVSGLRVLDPLGVAPIVTADASMRGLDLEQLTRTFSFGLIEGRLDGDLDALRLVAWEPDRFDLHLYTPPGDRARRRISQRAVENLTELGSGIPAGLSVPLLGLFEEFGYSAIDLKIELRGDAASIDGLAREDGGYYLVRGSGLPRIDVIGRNRRVAWRDLVERLKEIQVEQAKIK
jgi:hypothetical protein